MNWDQIEGKWKELGGHVKQKWGKLTDDDITEIEGNREKLIGKLQSAYGTNKQAAERQADEWQRTLKT